MAFIPNKELYIGLSGCVTALACLWANAMRKKNRNTKTRLRQELMDLRNMLVGPDEDRFSLSASSPGPLNVTEPCREMEQAYDNIPMNVSAPCRRGPPHPAGRRGTAPRHSSQRESTSSREGGGSLMRGRQHAATENLHEPRVEGVRGERLLVYPLPGGCILSPIGANQGLTAAQRQNERIRSQIEEAGMGSPVQLHPQRASLQGHQRASQPPCPFSPQRSGGRMPQDEVFCEPHIGSPIKSPGPPGPRRSSRC